MYYDILYAGMGVCLINCFLDRDKLTYGFGYFGNNTPSKVILRDGDGNLVSAVAIPDEIVVKGFEVLGDKEGINELQRIHFTS
jgi:hypothetical protein